MQHDSNEAFSRVLIDKALEFSGWNLLDSHQVRFELNTENGRADYLLGGQRGPLCVLEAKREDVDPYDAKEQNRVPVTLNGLWCSSELSLQTANQRATLGDSLS